MAPSATAKRGSNGDAKTITPDESKTGTIIDLVRREVALEGITPIMFDPYPGDNDTQLEIEKKMYFMPEDGKTLCIPSSNIVSFLSAQNTVSAPQRLGMKGWRKVAMACLSYVSIEPMYIPIMRDGKPVVFGGRFERKGNVLCDPKTGMVVRYDTARVKGGIPNPKVRPVLHTPWSISFSLVMYPNNEIKEATVRELFQRGGIALGLGTWRGVFGKFQIVKWE